MNASFSARAGELSDRMPWWMIIAANLAVLVAVNLVVSCFALVEEDPPIDIPNVWLMLGIVVFVVPLLETLFFQCGIVELSIRILKFVSLRCRYAAGVAASALFFGTSHWNFAALMSAVGLIFAFNYLIFRRRGGVWHACAMTFLLHAIYNGIACIGDFV